MKIPLHVILLSDGLLCLGHPLLCTCIVGLVHNTSKNGFVILMIQLLHVLLTTPN